MLKENIISDSSVKCALTMCLRDVFICSELLLQRSLLCVCVCVYMTVDAANKRRSCDCKANAPLLLGLASWCRIN